jgi:protoporphyrinogen oxidase
MTRKRAIIIGAGPAGLTAAYELLKSGHMQVTVLEATRDIGGLSKTVNYKGNRIDIGGHRFFSKSDWVMDWWLKMLPLSRADAGANGGHDLNLAYQGQHRSLRSGVGTPQKEDDRVMLVRGRLSRIYFNGKFFDYPLKANLDTALKLGLGRCFAFACSYAYAVLFPRKPERTLEDFFINRFGRLLYLQFFKSYTEKVWGTPCNEISAEWGAQRVKSLSIASALRHAIAKLFRKSPARAENTSLIEQFLYPKFGPGLMWETAAERIRELGGNIVFEAPVVSVEHEASSARAVIVRRADGTEERYGADYVLSTMPVRELVLGMQPPAPAPVSEVARGLEYRDFITVGLLYKRLAPINSGNGPLNLVPDNWIYIQEHGVNVGRLQVFNNWSPYMVADPNTVWVGMEFFCREGDRLWCMADDELVRMGKAEMEKLKLAAGGDCLDGVVIRMPKAYPAYYGTYDRFSEIRAFLDPMKNLFLIGRNGMHRYNNQDHSMLSARMAADAILTGSADKSRIWDVNIDDEYHEERADSGSRRIEPKLRPA